MPEKRSWHQVLSLTEEAQVKITENLEAVSEFYARRKESGIKYAPGFFS